MIDPLLHIVLLAPQIPNNTGNIGRTAVAAGCVLHLIHPLGFELSEKARRRAGLDYWEHLHWREHASWDDFLERERPGRLWLYTTKSTTPHWDAELHRGDYLLFGQETGGVPDRIHEEVARRWGRESRVTLPMQAEARSLNLATSVCVAVYEGMRQLQ